ncbi:MAG: HNH endonuclease [Pirellulaceae bacterium]|nr:HNH endonuclease [Pirellulaceae bacterium]
MISATLRRPALVLNRNWQPVNIATVSRAITLVWNRHAQIVEPNDFQLYDWNDWSKLEPEPGELFIQAVSQRFRVPEVIALTRFDRLPSANVAFNRRNLFKRDRHACQYCGKRPEADELTIDHVIPRSQGGLSSWANCVLACVACNHRKADRTPEQAHMKLRKTPIQPTWNPGYWRHATRIDSWQKFISDVYWTTELDLG